MASRQSSRRRPVPCAAASLLAASLSVFAASAHAATATSQEFIQVWRRPSAGAPKAAAAPAMSSAPTSAPAPPPATATRGNAIAEAKLAAAALRDEQTRLATEASARSQAELARTAAENERLLLTGQVAPPRPIAPLSPPPKPAEPALPAKPGDPRPAMKTGASRRAGLLEEMLDSGMEPEGRDDGITEAALKQMLAEALQRAAEHTPQMHQVYAEYRAAEADVDQAKGQRWPQLSLSGQTRERRFGDQRDTPANPGNTVRLNMTTTLFDWGQTRKTIDSRKELASANNERYRAQLENLAYQAVNTMLELSRQRRIADLYQRYVDRMNGLAHMLEEIAQADRGRASELTQARARLLQAQTSRDAAVAKARDAELALRKLVGDEPVAMPDTAAWPISPADLPRLLSSVERHPAVLQAAAQARAADLNTAATRASSLPKLSWVVSGGTGRDDAGYRQPWATMLAVNWPLFSGGSQRAAASAAQYRAEAQWHNAGQQRLDYEFQLRTADEDARTAFRRASDYASLSRETDRIRKGFVEQWYQLGQRTLLDVLSAESDYYNNRIGEVSSRFDAYQAVMREYASAGELIDWMGTTASR